MIDTHSILREGLDLLKPHLLRYLQVELKAAYGDGRREPRLHPSAHPDVQALLSVLLDHWHKVFARRLRPADRGLAHELKRARNLWAHEQPVTFDQAYRALDSVQLLLASIGGESIIPAVERKKAQMRRLQVELESAPRLAKPVSPPSSRDPSQASDYWTLLGEKVSAVYQSHPDLVDHRGEYPWLTGALGDPHSGVWFVGENPSLRMVARARDPYGGLPTPEAQWWASRGDRLFRDMLVKHGFKAAPAEAPGGWCCYITNAIKEADYATKWRGSPAERHRRAARIWSPVLRWELQQSKPRLIVALGQTVRRILDSMEIAGGDFPRIETIHHYSYIAHRPHGSLGPMHPDRVRDYDEQFSRIAALASSLHQPREAREAPASGRGGSRRSSHSWREGDDIVAFYIQRYGAERLPYDLKELAKAIGVTEGTLRMRAGNFKALSGEGGLGNWSKQSERVFDALRTTDEATHRQQALDHIADLKSSLR